MGDHYYLFVYMYVKIIIKEKETTNIKWFSGHGRSLKKRPE